MCMNLLAISFKDLAQYRVILTSGEIQVIRDLLHRGRKSWKETKTFGNRQLPGCHALVIREEKTDETLGKPFHLLIRACAQL